MLQFTYHEKCIAQLFDGILMTTHCCYVFICRPKSHEILMLVLKKTLNDTVMSQYLIVLVVLIVLIVLAHLLNDEYRVV